MKQFSMSALRVIVLIIVSIGFALGDHYVLAEADFCSLHDAILAANTDSQVGGCAAGDGDDVIDLSGITGSIRLDAPLPPITDSLTIVGPGASDLTIHRGVDDEFRIFTVQGGSVLIADLTISRGRDVMGAGILVEGGDLTLQGVTLYHNFATSSGGAIALTGGSLALTVGTQLYRNSAISSGGGIYAENARVTISDSDIYFNDADSSGGGLYSSGDTIISGSLFRENRADSVGGAIAQVSGTLFMRSSTISDNRAPLGGGMYVGDGTARAEHVTIAYNQSDRGGGLLATAPFDLRASILSDNAGGNCNGAVQSQGDNLSSDESCTLGAAGDQSNEPARLTALESHGGMTLVHRPGSDSPAIGAASGCGGVDQRGATRAGSGCDSGAVETPASVPARWISATSGSWHTATNWVTGIVPSTNDDAILDVPAAVTVTISNTVTVNSIASNEHLQQTSGTVTVAAASTFNNAYTLTGGTLTGAGARTFTGNTTWAGGTLSGAGAIANTGLMNISGTSSKSMNATTLTNNSRITWTGGSIYLNNRAVLNNAAAGVLAAHASDEEISWTSSPAGQLINVGTIVGTSGVFYPSPAQDVPLAAVGSGRIYIEIPFVNSGTVDAQRGVIDLNNTSSSNGVYNGAVRFIAGTHTLVSGASVNGGSLTGGTLTISDNATVALTNFTQSSGTLNLLTGATINLTNVALNGGTANLRGTVAGTVTVSGGSHNVYFGTQIIGALTLSAGDMEFIETVSVIGDMTWTGGYIYGAGLTISAAGELIIDGVNDKYVNAATVITNNGTARFISDSRIVCSFCNGGTFQNNGTFTVNVPGGAEAEFYNVNLNNAGTLTLETPAYIWRGSSPGTFVGGANGVLRTENITLTAGAQINGAITFTSGVITANGTATVNGDLTWTGGYLYGSGLTIAPAGELIIDGLDDKFVNNETLITNNGTTLFKSASRINCAFCNGGNFTNNGTLTVEAPDGGEAQFLDVNLNNAGTLTLETALYAGRTITQSAGTWTFAGGNLRANLTLNGGTITGTGTITGALVNNATVQIGAAPGTLTISGSYTQGSAGSLTAQIGGAAVGTGYDRLAVSGAVTLAGTLNLTQINSYDPAIGTLFDIITYGSRSGTFTTVTGAAIGGGKQFTVSYPAGKVTITTAAG